MENNELMQSTSFDQLSTETVIKQITSIQELMSSVMKEGEHFGKIPGCQKPSLLKPGAEKLGFTFRLAPDLEVIERDFPGGHREYRIKCILKHIVTGAVVGYGLGSASTMESKYRYRNASDYEIQDDPIPADYRERKQDYRKQGFGAKQIEGQWYWVKYTENSKVENPDIADTYNTVLKMARKRAHIDAILTATAASDIFTQDVDDMSDKIKTINGNSLNLSAGEQSLSSFPYILKDGEAVPEWFYALDMKERFKWLPKGASIRGNIVYVKNEREE